MVRETTFPQTYITAAAGDRLASSAVTGACAYAGDEYTGQRMGISRTKKTTAVLRLETKREAKGRRHTHV